MKQRTHETEAKDGNMGSVNGMQFLAAFGGSAEDGAGQIRL